MKLLGCAAHFLHKCDVASFLRKPPPRPRVALPQLIYPAPVEWQEARGRTERCENRKEEKVRKEKEKCQGNGAGETFK